jgi:hypothetical protein
MIDSRPNEQLARIHRGLHLLSMNNNRILVLNR